MTTRVVRRVAPKIIPAAPTMTYDDLTDEQQEMIDMVRKGKNVLVDACIGSGKTTAIQVLCSEMKNLNVLYLTYNKLLKADAKNKIRNKNSSVTNYHGYAWYAYYKSTGEQAGLSDSIKLCLADDSSNPYGDIDLLVLDEYQDIDEQIADLLMQIKSKKKGRLQIVAVGDMKQKIYDNSTLDAWDFIMKFMESPTILRFTKCFRINKELGDWLGEIWGKTINGVNGNCKVMRMTFSEAYKHIAGVEPKDLLVIGKKKGLNVALLNKLEEDYPDTFNKRTVYAKIDDSNRGNDNPLADSAIFTTYDGCKGMERDVCVVFDFDIGYWETRSNMSMTKFEILRNIFCVAASRGKREIIFVKGAHPMLTKEDLMNPFASNREFKFPFSVSTMFDFKYREDVEACLDYLDLTTLSPAEPPLDVPTKDGNIDISPALGEFQEAVFFDKYNIDEQIEHTIKLEQELGKFPALKPLKKNASLKDKILYDIYASTHHERYVKQVDPEFVSSNQELVIKTRLREVFNGDEVVQFDVEVDAEDIADNSYTIYGRCDVIRNNTVYELKFTDGLMTEHFLQCAVYMYALNLDKGILWNTKTNESVKIEFKKGQRKAFMTAVMKAATKGVVQNAYVDYVTGWDAAKAGDPYDGEDEDELESKLREKEGRKNMQRLLTLEEVFGNVSESRKDD